MRERTGERIYGMTGGYLFQPAQVMDKGIVVASEYFKEFTHGSHLILHPVMIDDVLFYPCPHLFSADRRKSRSNLFFILKFWLSYACSASLLTILVSFPGRSYGLSRIPPASFACLRLYQLIQFLIRILLSPKRSSISVICVYFFLHKQTPPVLGLFSYTGGVWSIVRFYWTSSHRAMGFSFMWSASPPCGFWFTKIDQNWRNMKITGYQKSDYALNKYGKGIVCRFADGILELAEQAYIEWKAEKPVILEETQYKF